MIGHAPSSHIEARGDAEEPHREMSGKGKGERGRARGESRERTREREREREEDEEEDDDEEEEEAFRKRPLLFYNLTFLHFPGL